MSHTLKDSPTIVLFERDTSSSVTTDSSGCVVCPSSALGSCDDCTDNEECNLRAPTCSSCSEYYCAASGKSSRSKSEVGPIVGGIIGGLAAILLIGGFIFWKYFYKKKSITLEDKDIVLSGMNNTGGESNTEYSISHMESHIADPKLEAEYRNTVVQPRVLKGSRPDMNRRLSSYESFTRPKKLSAERIPKNRVISENVNTVGRSGPYADEDSNKRNSVATSISTTAASNILPIAYIPGVTVRPTKNNTRSIYSYDSESIFSDLNTIENASIVGDVVKAKNHSGRDARNGTTTAIKAQPRLINVDRIEEEDEEDEEDEEEEDDYATSENDHSGETETAETTRLHSLKLADSDSQNTNSNLNGSTLSNVAFQNDKLDNESDIDFDVDSDVDSDIGEIARATSVRKNTAVASDETDNLANSSSILPKPTHSSINDNGDVYIDITELHKPDLDVASGRGSNGGSFFLDVQFDNTNSGDESDVNRSPFEDPE